MRGVTSFRLSGLFCVLAVVCALLLAAAAPADAKKRGYRPPYAALVVDAKTGKVLHSDNADAVRHPASLTKVMTLYIVFEELRRGTITLDTPLRVSVEASRQSPSKLGLKPGETISVKDAILALVTKSANDVAVVVAENISGTEAAFAKRMTRKARALGMNSTIYRNASGLPDDEQVTTARDLVTLGRAIQDNYPEEYKYFATRKFTWKGRTYGNHNKLLGKVDGVDGIKTGYIRASGFNLLISAKTGGRYVVAVVMGGRTGATRDAAMRKLLANNMDEATRGKRTAPMIVEAPMPPEPLPTIALALNPPLPVPRPDEHTLQPAFVAAAAVPMPPLPAAPPAPDAPAAADLTKTPDEIARRIATATAMATTTPSPELRWMIGAQPAAGRSVYTSAYAGTTPGSPAPLPRMAPAPIRVAPAAAIRASMLPTPPARQTAAATPQVESSLPTEPPLSGWQIQVGATPNPSQAEALIERASAAVRRADKTAEPFTEPVEKDGVTLYRARFAGFSEHTAYAACKAVKRASLGCFAIKN